MRDHLKIPILNEEFAVIVCWGDRHKVFKIMTSYGYDADDSFSICKKMWSGTLRGKTLFDDSTCTPIIALPKAPKSAVEIGAPAHEAVHAVEYIFEKIGEDSHHEVFAHSVAAVVRQTLRYVRRGKLRR